MEEKEIQRLIDLILPEVDEGNGSEWDKGFFRARQIDRLHLGVSLRSGELKPGVRG